MSDQYVGEIRMFSGNYAPEGWAFCDGKLLPISNYEALFSLIGVTYGGDGQTSFALPDLRGRIPMNQGTASSVTYTLGQVGGSETVTLTTAQLPGHTHIPVANQGAGTTGDPTGAYWAQGQTGQYSTAAPDAVMNPQAVYPAGGNQPHDNMMPTLTLSYIISFTGNYPTPD